MTGKILDSETKNLKISALPTRPMMSVELGGAGYTVQQMKEAFDALPLLIIERFNLLLDDVSREGEDSLASAMPTGIKDGQTLTDLFSEITSGAFASYLTVDGSSLMTAICDIKSRLDALEAKNE